MKEQYDMMVGWVEWERHGQLLKCRKKDLTKNNFNTWNSIQLLVFVYYTLVFGCLILNLKEEWNYY